MPGRLLRLVIVRRLLVAFVLVSLLPTGVLAYLSFTEEHASEAPAGEHVEGGNEAGGEPGSTETLAGIPTASIELGVAIAGFVLSVGVALYVGRTIVRPIRALDGTMRRVEGGDLEARAQVTSEDEIGRLTGSFNRMVEAVQREALVRDLFGQYVTPEVAEVAIEQRGRLDGQLARSTVVFSDIRDFTGLTEATTPAMLIELLNRYFERMTAVVHAEGGFVNKFGGDSLLAVFGTPLNPAEDHATRAVRAALEMRSELAGFNREQAAAGLPEIQIGIGIATGDVVAGNVGGSARVEYTVIGDVVNVAARLQMMTREIGYDTIASAETASAAGETARFASCGRVTVRGRSAPVEAYSIEA